MKLTNCQRFPCSFVLAVELHYIFTLLPLASLDFPIFVFLFSVIHSLFTTGWFGFHNDDWSSMLLQCVDLTAQSNCFFRQVNFWYFLLTQQITQLHFCTLKFLHFGVHSLPYIGKCNCSCHWFHFSNPQFLLCFLSLFLKAQPMFFPFLPINFSINLFQL